MKKKYSTLRLFVLLLAMLQVACGQPEESTRPLETITKPSPAASKLNFAEALERLTKLEKSLASWDSAESLTFVNDLKQSFEASFPLEIPVPFALHSFQDLLMKDTRAIKSKGDKQLITAWQALLDAINQKKAFHGIYEFPVDTKVLSLVLSGAEPKLTTELREDFTAFTEAERKERNSISLESFWQPAFLYHSNSGHSAEQDTGAILITDDSTMVGLLEFKNKLATPKAVDLNKESDLVNVVPNTPGYVSSVGRRAAYARFDIGKLLFAKFFDYARANHIAQSYLHVREDNDAAINLYKSLGYKIMATVPRYYQTKPPIGAYVMRKIF